MGLETETNVEISEECDEALYELVEETEADKKMDMVRVTAA